MIECTDKKIWYIKHRKKKKWRCFKLLLILLIIFGIFAYYYNVICKTIFNVCADFAKAYATQSVNLAILQTLNNEDIYNDLIIIEKNSNGDITLISTNSIKVNNINKKIANKTDIILQKKLNDGIPVPILAFLGIEIFTGYGSTVNFKTLSVVSVNCDFSSQFKSVGINQTLHSLYITVNAECSIHMPLKNEKINSSTSVLITETVLVGKVPDIYLNDSIFK